MGRKPEAKLPVRQLAILAVCRFAEPVALTSVYPYLPEMIESFGVPTDKVAKWAGLASASFSFAQCLTAIIWGQLSDRFGRKYVVLVSLACTMITSLNFGLSRSLTAMITARALGGAGSGSVGVVRTTVAELVPQKELQPRAFSVMPLVWTIGSILGPSFGGALANPVKHYPSIFQGSWLFETYPFLLPNLVAAIFFLVGITVGILFLRETLATKKHRRDYGLMLGQALSSLCRRRKPKRPIWQTNDESEPLITGDSTSMADPTKSKPTPYKRPRYRDVLSPQSNLNLLVYTLLAMHSQSFDQLLPIFMHHPPQPIDDPDVRLPLKFSGGFGISSSRIGLLFTIYGVVGMCIQFLAFPPIAKKFGVLNCLRAVAVCFPIIYLLTPFTALIPSALGKQIAMVALMLCKCWLGIFAFPCSTILLTNSAASLSILGTLNGLATSTSAAGRAAGPFIGGNMFTFGVDRGYVIAPWWLVAMIATVAAVPVFYLKEMEGFGTDEGDEESSADEEDEIDATLPVAPGRISRISSKSSIVTDEDAVEEASGPPLRPIRSSERRMSGVERRLSGPLGMGYLGSRNARRYSNSLGVTRMGYGAEPRQGT